jgi:threonine synthase
VSASVDDRAHGWALACERCDARFAFAAMYRGCPHCAARGEVGVLDIVAPAGEATALSRRRGAGLERYRDLLPGGDASDWVTLGAGGTPLLRARRIGRALGLDNLHFKLEGANPTGSFKDRYVAVATGLARNFGFTRVVTSSTGNLGVSVAAFAAAAGLRCAVVVPHGAPVGIIDEMRALDAHVFATAAAQRAEIFEAIAARDGWFPIAATYRRPIQTPFGIEGYKSYAYELIEQLGEAPAAMLFPCARGNGLHGAWKGFVESRARGWCSGLPAMHACQPIGADSLAASLARGVDEPVELPRIASLAFSAAEPVASRLALRAIRDSGGGAFAASEDEIAAAHRALLAEGINVEPSSALPVACLGRLVAAGRVDPRSPIVCVLTAAGQRWPSPPRNDLAPIRAIDDAAAIATTLRALES